jgi:GNAT superfamily N-acetyltransferase
MQLPVRGHFGRIGRMITVLSAADLPECCDLAESRGWWREEHKWRLLFDVGAVYGLRDGAGRLVGTTVLTRYGHTAAAISMVLVAADQERRGLGRQLMERALADAGDAPVFLNATSYGRPLYERLGFTPLGTTYTHIGVLNGVEPSGRTRPATEADLDAIAALDAEVTGCDRTQLLRRLPAFASTLRVAEHGSAITGYAGVWDNQGTAMVGPVVAADEDHARDLIGDVVAGATGAVRLDLEAAGLCTWAGRHGADLRYSTTVMVYGSDRLPGDRRRWYLPVMQALG